MKRPTMNAQAIIGKGVSILGAGTQGRRLAYMVSPKFAQKSQFPLSSRNFDSAHIHGYGQMSTIKSSLI